jgi:hypothetical protein
MVRRTFREAAPGAEADLVLDVQVADAELQSRATGWLAFVEHAVVLRERSGLEVARWQVSGDGPLLRETAQALHAAFARAAEAAAARFESTFEDPRGVRQWLAGHGSEPVSLRARWGERANYVAYLDVGGGFVSADDNGVVSLAARAGVASPWLVLNVTGGGWSTTFGSKPVFSYYSANVDTRMVTRTVGADLGLVHRFGSALELRAGGGVHRLWGHADTPSYLPFGSQPPTRTSFTFRQWAPAVFAGAQYSQLVLAGGVRLRVSIEFRRYFGASVEFPELTRTVSIADNFLGLFLGFELPLSSSRRGSGS